MFIWQMCKKQSHPKFEQMISTMEITPIANFPPTFRGKQLFFIEAEISSNIASILFA